MAYIGFKKLAAKTSPAIAASIGRKKYGNKAFNKAASEGKKMKGMKPKRKGGIISKLQTGGKTPHRKPVTKQVEYRDGSTGPSKSWANAGISGTKSSKVKQNFNRTVEKTNLNTYDHDTDTSTQKKYKKVTRNPVSRLFPNKKVKEKSSESQSRYVGEAKMDKSSDTYPVYDHTKPYKSKVTKTTTRPSGRTKTITKTEEGGKKTRTKEISQGKPFKWWKSPPPQPSKLQRGGIAQGKSPGVDTPTTIDGTTYYQEGGTVKETKEKKDNKKEKSNLDKISEALNQANVEREAIGTEDDIKARKLKREQDILKQKAKFKKGGKMKYRKGGIVSKLQTGGTGDENRKPQRRTPYSPQNRTDFVTESETDKSTAKKKPQRRTFLRELLGRSEEEIEKRRTPYSPQNRRGYKKGGQGYQKGGIIGKIKKKLKEKKGKGKPNYEDVGGRAVNTKTPEISPVSTAKDKIKEDLKKGNRYQDA